MDHQASAEQFKGIAANTRDPARRHPPEFILA